jgi:hypothetical protein
MAQSFAYGPTSSEIALKKPGGIDEITERL